MPDPDPPLAPEEEEAMNRLAVQWLQAHVNIFTPLYVLLSGICEPYAREPARWPFRLRADEKIVADSALPDRP
jgi:hypothetical protein